MEHIHVLQVTVSFVVLISKQVSISLSEPTTNPIAGASRPDTASTTLSVLHSPRIINTFAQTMAAAEVGDQVAMYCRVSAKPQPAIKWYLFDVFLHLQ
jgi:hypothetical protein